VTHFGARILGENLGFAMAAILTLALGIGANTAIFTVTSARLKRSSEVKVEETSPSLQSLSRLARNQGEAAGLGIGLQLGEPPACSFQLARLEFY